jgi:hypothetical protein
MVSEKKRYKKFLKEEDFLIYHLKYHNSMARLRTNAKRKLNKALTRVEKVVVMDVREMLEQQRKWKAKVMNSKGTK